MRIESIVIAGCLTCFLATGSVFAKEKDKNKGKGAEPKTVALNASAKGATKPSAAAEGAKKEPWLNVDVTIGAPERQVIQEYVNHCDQLRRKREGKGLPPGLAKKVAHDDPLPPGWQKKCVPGEVMPVAVYEHVRPLPQEVVVKLPPPPAGTILVAVNGKVVRLAKATREILDVFDVRVF